MLSRLQAIALILIGIALSLAAASRFLVERLNGSDPWTPAAYISLVALAGGIGIGILGVVKFVRRS